MQHSFRLLATFAIALSLTAQIACSLRAAEWSIPIAGNAFRTSPTPGSQGFSRKGYLSWSGPEEVFSIYFHVDRPAFLTLAIKGRVPAGHSTLAAKVQQHSFRIPIDSPESTSHQIGRVAVSAAGYVRVDIQGLERDGQVYAEMSELLVASDTEDLELSFVKTDERNMFYWGRRGPSVHLRYQLPPDGNMQYAYSEIRVPEGLDPIGSYFMANGFAEGYFGIQVNGATERRVLFSIWSPFKTDNPRDVPQDQRIVLVRKGASVRVGEFGNEGSGGQSYMIYPWKAGITYRFLTEVKPDGEGSTLYTSWFADKDSDEWMLIASFRRPQTTTYLRGFHSFLESFNPDYGYLSRRADYCNVWVCDVAGAWHECTTARFSVDATGSGRHRLDFSGGAEDDCFSLMNCGFFNTPGTPGATFTRTSTAGHQPDIDFNSLP